MRRNLVVLCIGLFVVLTFTRVRADQPSAKPTILVPDQAFPGGVLTGVVLGPDEQPVPNAPVEVSGGVPATLSGEVVGDQAPQQPQLAEKQPRPTAKPPIECGALPQRSSGSPGAPAGMADSSVRQLVTDASGRFALCMAPDAPHVTVALTDGTKSTVRAFTGPITLPSDPPSFFQPGQKIDFTGGVRDARAEQGGNTWSVPVVQAWSSDGSQTVSTLLVPRAADPGPVQLSYTRPDGRRYRAQASVFRIAQASLDQSRLHSDEGAAFDYTVQFAAQGEQQLCVQVHVGGPVVLSQAPPPVIAIDASGVGKFGGRVRATPVAPGSTTPFTIEPRISVCGGSGTAEVVAEDGGPARATVPIASLKAGPPVLNPWATPEHTEAASSGQSTVATAAPHTGGGKAQFDKEPMSLGPCNPLTTGPVITAVTDRQGKPTSVFTPNEFYDIHGCNFGDDGQVYLVFPATRTQPALTYGLVPSGDDPSWLTTLVRVRFETDFGGRLDQKDITLRLVVSGGGTAERPKQSFYAARETRIITWFPAVHLALGTAQYQGHHYPPVVTFQGTGPQDSSVLMTADSPNEAAGVVITRTAIGVDGPFSVAPDDIEFSRMLGGFSVSSVQPFFPPYVTDCAYGKDQVVGNWSMQWVTKTRLRVYVSSCYRASFGSGSSEASYGFNAIIYGPRGVNPWDPTQ